MSTPFDLSCLGTCNIDFVSRVPFFAQAEEEVNIEKMHICLGGSAFNFTSRVSSLGIKTAIMARVGEDCFGELFTTELNQLNVDTSQLLSVDAKTGLTFINIDDEAEKSLYSFTGANADFKLEKEDIKLIKNSNLLHITGMYLEVVEEASKHTEKLSFNPGPVTSSFGMEKLKNTLKRTQILFLNQKEVTLLTGMGWEEGSSFLVDLGIPMVVVTSGREGARLFTQKEVIFSPAKKVHTMDTTGAGDNFAAGFITSYIKGEEPEDCLKFANHIASLCVQKMGGSASGKIDL